MMSLSRPSQKLVGWSPKDKHQSTQQSCSQPFQLSILPPKWLSVSHILLSQLPRTQEHLWPMTKHWNGNLGDVSSINLWIVLNPNFWFHFHLLHPACPPPHKLWEIWISFISFLYNLSNAPGTTPSLTAAVVWNWIMKVNLEMNDQIIWSIYLPMY